MTDDPLERGTPPGSLRQFGVLYASAGARPLLRALYAFEAEVDDAVRAANHDIAHTRLQWWRGEVDRLVAGRAQHPVTCALSLMREFAPDALPLLHELLVAADIELARMTFQDEREFESYCTRAGGSLQTLAACVSAGSASLTDAEQSFANRLGSAIKQADLLCDLRLHVMAGRLPFPLDALDSAGVAPRDLQAECLTQGVADFLESRRVRIDRAVRDALEALPPGRRAVQRQAVVLGALYRKLLARMAHRTDLSRMPPNVPALQRVWTAWRTALSAR
jgi:phytoene synthase